MLRVEWVKKPTELDGFDGVARGVWIGDKHYPWARVWRWQDSPRPWEPEGDAMKMRGVEFGFENGLRLSVIWGSCTYSDNYDHPVATGPWVEEPGLVEVGLCHGEGGIMGDPLAWCDVDDLPELIDKVGALPSTTDRPPEWWDYWHEAHQESRVFRHVWEVDYDEDDGDGDGGHQDPDGRLDYVAGEQDG